MTSKKKVVSTGSTTAILVVVEPVETTNLKNNNVILYFLLFTEALLIFLYGAAWAWVVAGYFCTVPFYCFCDDVPSNVFPVSVDFFEAGDFVVMLNHLIQSVVSDEFNDTFIIFLFCFKNLKTLQF